MRDRRGAPGGSGSVADVPATTTVHAAGVLCWTGDPAVPSELRVLLVRRPDYGDFSVPKGKVDPGELTPQTAARELVEETGIRAALGAPVGEVRYKVSSGPKVVDYWLSEVRPEQIDEARFTPNAEIEAVEWVRLADAPKAVTYDYDRTMLRTLTTRLRQDTARTFSITIVRHGKAVPPSTWDGPDSTRPLLHRGMEQSLQIAPAIAAFGPTKLVTSTATRCWDTMAPLADYATLPLKAIDGLSQDAYELGRATVDKQISKRLRKQENVVLCSHGPVIPDLVRSLTIATGAKAAGLQRAANLATGDFAVFHLTRGDAPRLVDVEVHSPS